MHKQLHQQKLQSQKQQQQHQTLQQRILTPIQPDDLITLTEAASILPKKKTGKRVDVGTIRRWGISGKITLYRCNGWKVSETELRSKFGVQVVRGGR